MRAHPDDVFDGHFGAPAGDGDPGPRFEVVQGGADDDRDRQTVELTQIGHQRDAPDDDHGVVLALGQGAVIVVDLGLGGGA